jgi:hypothetical protein
MMKVKSYKLDNNEFYFHISNRLDQSRAQQLISKILYLLTLKGDGIMETLKLQVIYELAHINEEDKVEQIKTFFETEINTLIKEITSYQTTSKKEYESIQIHKKIFSFLLIKTKQNTFNSSSSNNLGSASEKEIYAMLDNVLPISGLPPFITLSAHDKISQLNDLCNIIMGIRLLNAELGKGGIGLMTFSEITKLFNSDLALEVKSYYESIQKICDKYTSIYSNVDFIIIEDMLQLENLGKIRKYILYFRQVLTYLTMLMDDLNATAILIDNLCQSYEKELKGIKEIIDKNSPVSKEQAYPKFENLSKMYIKFQEQSFILNIRENVFHKLQDFIETNTISIDLLDQDLVKEWTDLVDLPADRDIPDLNFEPGMYQNGVSVYLPFSTADFYNIRLDYQGVCIVTLITKQGLLINGKPNIVLKYKDKHLVFSSLSKVQEFMDRPDYFMNSVINYVKKNSYLINLLNMIDEFPMANLSVLFRDKDLHTFKYKSSSILVDKAIQTPTHIDENGYIDKDHVWNEWDLKRNAIQLADIMRKKTVSCQTILSHFRRENETQIYPLKEEGVNTTVSKGTNLSIPKSYISDVRKYESKY